MLLDTKTIFTVLEGSYQHYLVPKRINSASELSGIAAIFNFGLGGALQHPLKLLLWVAGVAGLLGFLLHRYTKRASTMADDRLARKGSYNRLD